MRLPACLLILVVAVPAAGQVTDTSRTRIFDVAGDSLVMRTVDGRNVSETLRPRVRDGDTRVRAERMADRGAGMYRFTGDVEILDQADTLTADVVLYDRNTKIGRATGDVRLGDGDVVVTAPEGDYDTRAKRADFRSGVMLVDSASTLRSTTGSYWTEERRAEFAGGVRLVQDSLALAADSMIYLRDTRFAEAWSGVAIRRLERKSVTWVFGSRSVSDEETGRGTVRGDVLLLRVTSDSTGADSLWIRSGRMDFVRTDSTETITAVDSVRIVGPDFAALADSVVYHTVGDRRETRFFGTPVAWFGSAQVRGDSLRATGTDQSMDSLTVDGAARLALRDSSSAPLQQLKGRRMVGLFDRDSLRTMIVTSNAEALYHMASGERPDAGAVKTSGDRIVLELSGGEVTDIRIYEGVEGTYYPASLVDESLRLEGVTWTPDLRPGARPLLARYLTARCRLDDAGCAAPAELP